jgi:pyrroline-5-carboxylate reductase
MDLQHIPRGIFLQIKSDKIGPMEGIGIIGYGNMGSAVARGLIRKGTLPGIYEKSPERAEAARRAGRTDGDKNTSPGPGGIRPTSETGLRVFDNLEELFAAADTLVLAIKPQDFPSLLAEIPPLVGKHRFVSVAAGVPIHRIQEHLGTGEICRFMPNLAAAVGKSAVGVAFAEGATEDFVSDALEVARAIGTPFRLPEHLIPAFTGLSGSGIAYVFAFLHALSLGGVKSGIPYDTSLKIALDTLEGAVEVLRQGGHNPAEMLSRVVSPAGTTIAGVSALEHGGFSCTVMDAVVAAADRAAEMER